MQLHPIYRHPSAGWVSPQPGIRPFIDMTNLHEMHMFHTRRPVTLVTFVQLVRLKAEAGCRLPVANLGASA